MFLFHLPWSSELISLGILVVKLFNAIQQSQAASAAVAEEMKSHRESGKPTLPPPAIHDKKKKGKQKDNIIGRGTEC